MGIAVAVGCTAAVLASTAVGWRIAVVYRAGAAGPVQLVWALLGPVGAWPLLALYGLHGGWWLAALTSGWVLAAVVPVLLIGVRVVREGTLRAERRELVARWVAEMDHRPRQ